MTWFRRSVHPEEDLSAYVDGELDERARRAVETHLASCEACSSLVTELQGTKSLLSELPRVEPRRSLALGPEFAVPRRVAPAPRRMSLSFAPAVALTLLVGLLFVDAIDSTGGSGNDGAFNTAASSSGSTAASRAAEPKAGAGQSLGAAKAPDVEADTAGGAADASTTQDSSGSGSDQPNPAAAGASSAAAEAAPTEAGEAGAAASSALAPPSEASPEPETAPEPLASDSFNDDEEEAAADSPAIAPQESSPLPEAEDSSNGLSTLRILEIAAAMAFVVSLLLAVFLPRIVGREER